MAKSLLVSHYNNLNASREMSIFPSPTPGDHSMNSFCLRTQQKSLLCWQVFATLPCSRQQANEFVSEQAPQSNPVAKRVWPVCKQSLPCGRRQILEPVNELLSLCLSFSKSALGHSSLCVSTFDEFTARQAKRGPSKLYKWSQG